MDRPPHRASKELRRVARLAGAVVGLVAGVFYAVYLIPNSGGVLDANLGIKDVTLGVCSVLGLLLGAFLGPTLSVEPYLHLQEVLTGSSPTEIVGGTLGLVIALVIAALLAVPLLHLPDGIGVMATLAVTATLGWGGIGIGLRRKGDLVLLLDRVASARSVPSPASSAQAPDSEVPMSGAAVVDTSVLIDGRILDVASTGFLPLRLIIPGFVLEELQRIADAGDPLRRAKGRRGLSTVEGLQSSPDVTVEVPDVDFAGVVEVDSRLIRLARARGAGVMTTDYVLNRLARVEGLRVLNLNDLVIALKPIVSAGETMEVTIVREGKELHQGVGYLEDGTMVVVENGRAHIDDTVTATVTSVIQTPAGRMIFAMVPVPAGTASPGTDPVHRGEEPRPRSGGRQNPRMRIVNR